MIDPAKISINYIAKLEYTGSYKGMRYMMKKVSKTQTDEAGNETSSNYLRTYVWPEPLSFAKTDADKKTEKEFEFSSTGKEEAVRWLNEWYQKEYEKKE